MLTTHAPTARRRLVMCLVAAAAAVGGMHAAANAQNHKPWPEPSAYKTPAVKDKNAALEYMTIRDLMDTKFIQFVGEQYNGGEATWVPTDELTVLLEENQPLIKRLIEASKLPNYDFGIRYEDGYAALLPHLGHIRSFARILGADARRLAVAGRTDEATERLLTCLRLSRHVMQDKVLISSLVSIAITSLAVNQAEITARDFGMSDASRREFIKLAKSLLNEDPFMTRACLQTEKQLAITSIKPVIEGKGEHAGRELVKHLKGLLLEADAIRLIEPLNEEQLNEQVDLLTRYYAALNDAWVAKDAADRLKALEQRLTDGDFGVLVRHLAPALTKAYSALQKTTKEIEAVVALLEPGPMVIDDLIVEPAE